MSSKAPKVTLDDRNANKGTERGLGMLEHSLRTYGAGRSVLADKNGRIIAGNKTVERAQELGLPLEIIESDGKKLVVVRRTDLDLDSPEGRALAVADNRIAEVDLAWDPEVLAGLLSEGVPLDEFFLPHEIERLMVVPEDVKAVPVPQEDTKRKACPRCGFKPGDALVPSPTEG